MTLIHPFFFISKTLIHLTTVLSAFYEQPKYNHAQYMNDRRLKSRNHPFDFGQNNVIECENMCSLSM